MSFGGHSPKPGRSAPEGKPEPGATPNSDSGGSTPRAEGVNPRVSLADYERLKEVVKRLSDEKSAAYAEIDLLVNDNKDLKKREEDLLDLAKFSSLKTKEELVKAAVEAEVASGQETHCNH